MYGFYETDYYVTSVGPSGSYIGAYTNLVPSNGYEWTGGASGTAPTKYFCKEHPTDKTAEGTWIYENGATGTLHFNLNLFGF